MDYIIAGLGNPGKQYALTRHNVGWLSLDYIATKAGVKVNRLKFKALCGECIIDGKKVLLLKPETYMNASGESVMAAMNYYNIPPEKVFVICDDIALPSCKLRIRRQGSDGGHRGLKSIIYLTASDQFPRLKIGVSDRESRDVDLRDWVTGDLTKDELKALSERMDDIYDIAMLFVHDELETAMARYN